LPDTNCSNPSHNPSHNLACHEQECDGAEFHRARSGPVQISPAPPRHRLIHFLNLQVPGFESGGRTHQTRFGRLGRDRRSLPKSHNRYSRSLTTGSKRLLRGRGMSAAEGRSVSTGRDPVTGKYGQTSRIWPGHAGDDPDVTAVPRRWPSSSRKQRPVRAVAWPAPAAPEHRLSTLLERRRQTPWVSSTWWPACLAPSTQPTARWSA
jgi:hypothetical protein